MAAADTFTRPIDRHKQASLLSIPTASPASMSSSCLSLVASARSADSQPTAPTSIFSVPTQSDYSNIESVLLESATTTESLTASITTTSAASSSSKTAPAPKKKAKSQRQDEEQDGAGGYKMDYLEYLFPAPQRPPRYSQVKSSRAVTFPIYERPETHVLPAYTPAVHQVTLVLRKLEWLSPFEPSTVRGWKNLIMEINSTQLNFYTLENVPLLNRVKRSKTKKHYEFTPVEHEFIIETVKNNPSSHLIPSRLVKSYSLQHAKFGLPIDYKKRNACLRLRCETEQFLIHFISLDSMIPWANYLSIGINVSLDLDKREMPTDRIVPRRRRNRRNRHRAFSDTELIRRELAEPKHPRRASFSSESTGLKGKISRIFGGKRSQTVDMDQLFQEFVVAGKGKTELQQTAEVNVPEDVAAVAIGMSSSSSSSEQEDPLVGVTVPKGNVGIIVQAEADVHVDDEDEDIHSVRELHDSDDEDDEEEEEDDDDEEEDADRIQIAFKNFSLSSSATSSNDEKWSPEPKRYTRRKFLKDSLRCIKLLSNEDSWVGKKVVKTTRAPTTNAVSRLDSKAKNKSLEEYTVGLQGFIPRPIVS